jgi:hypothetical protein
MTAFTTTRLCAAGTDGSTMADRISVSKRERSAECYGWTNLKQLQVLSGGESFTTPIPSAIDAWTATSRKKTGRFLAPKLDMGLAVLTNLP